MRQDGQFPQCPHGEELGPVEGPVGRGGKVEALFMDGELVEEDDDEPMSPVRPNRLLTRPDMGVDESDTDGGFSIASGISFKSMPANLARSARDSHVTSLTAAAESSNIRQNFQPMMQCRHRQKFDAESNFEICLYTA